MKNTSQKSIQLKPSDDALANRNTGSRKNENGILK